MVEYYGVFMPSGRGLSDVERDLKRIYQERGLLAELELPRPGARARLRPVGLLIGRPECKVMKEELSPSIPYLHHRTGNDIDIFCMGYINPERYKGKNILLPHEITEGVEFIDAYDGSQFAKVVGALEAETNWKYSGETELIILYSFATRHDGPINPGFEDISVTLDFSSAIAIRLEQAVEAKMIPSVKSFLETVIRSAQGHPDHDVLQVIQGHLVLSAGKKGLVGLIASWLKIDANTLKNIANSQIVDLNKNFDAAPPWKFHILR